MKRIWLCLALVFFMCFAISLPAQTQKHNFVPENGYVPDENTAIRIAVAVWSSIYGEKRVQAKKPFKAKLNKGVWFVEGSLPKGWRGGVPEAEITKRDGRILRISHGK